MGWLIKFSGYDDDVKDNVLSMIGCPKDEALRDGCSGKSYVFMVPAGSLWFNLLVFSCCAAMAILHLFLRRKRWGGELGGPKKGFMGQYFSGCFLASLWFTYII